MAQASSIAREPSMEEILASIRKIIEESDAVQQAAVNTQPNRNVTEFKRPEEASETEVVTYSSARPFAANQPSEPKDVAKGAVQTAHEAGNNSADNKSHEDGFADNQFQRSEAANISQTYAESEVSFSPIDDDPAEQAEELDQVFVGNINLHDHNSEPEYMADTDLADAITQLIEEPQTEALLTTSADEETPEEAVSEPISEEVISREPLVSFDAEQRVAASFNNLAEALRAEQIRQLEEQAEALLQPLLKDWLDENLAPMVERLVQEEIQRIIGAYKI